MTILALWVWRQGERGNAVLLAMLSSALPFVPSELRYLVLGIGELSLFRLAIASERMKFSNWYILAVWSGMLKIAVFHWSIYPSTQNLHHMAWAWTILDLAAVMAFSVIFRKSFWFSSLWLTMLALSLLLWVDALYYRYFDDLPGLYLIKQSSQAGSAAPAAWAMRRWIDWAFFADLLVLSAYRLLNKPAWEAVSTSHRLAGAITIFVTVLVAVIPGAQPIDVDSWLKVSRGRNVWVLERVGIANYHLIDLSSFLSVAKKRNLTESELATWREMLSLSRHSLSKESKLRAAYKTRNVLIVQLESLQYFALDAKVGGEYVMPYTQELLKECIWGGLQDQTGQGRSYDGEFAILNSQLPYPKRPVVYSFPLNKYRGLPAALAAAGYSTNYVADITGTYANSRMVSKNYGFNNQFFEDSLGPHRTEDFEGGFALSDRVMIERSLPFIQKSPRPFYFHIVTYSGHHPFTEVPPKQYRLRPTGNAPIGKMLRDYLECCRQRDRNLKIIVESLKRSGLWESTVFCCYGDHDAGIPNEELANFLGGAPSEAFRITHDKVPFLIHLPKQEFALHVQHPLQGQVDFAPTLAYLLGLNANDLCMSGFNLLSEERHHVLLSQAGGGYALTENEIVIPINGGWKCYSVHPPYRELPGGASESLRLTQKFDWTRTAFENDIQRTNF